jgi:glycosyltransferase involved in cell wall biosynthesis
MKNGLVIPCYNESNRINFTTYNHFLDYNDDFVICFVNDGSSDDTLQKLNDLRLGRESKVFVLDLEINQGKAEAVRCGVNYLLTHTQVSTIGFIDADLSTSFYDYKQLIFSLKKMNTDECLVFGSRKLEINEKIERSSFRKIASEIVGYSIQKIIGLPIKDTQCGAKVFTRRLAEDVFRHKFITRWLFDVEIFLRMKRSFGKDIMNVIQEKPLSEWKDVEGSKLSVLDSIKVPFMVSKIALSYTFFI